MTCDGLDVIANNINTPVDLKIGDWLCFSGMGAYTYGSQTQFNGMRCVEKTLIWSGKYKEIAKNES
jgi:ornithine decarboxylase